MGKNWLFIASITVLLSSQNVLSYEVPFLQATLQKISSNKHFDSASHLQLTYIGNLDVGPTRFRLDYHDPSQGGSTTRYYILFDIMDGECGAITYRAIYDPAEGEEVPDIIKKDNRIEITDFQGTECASERPSWQVHVQHVFAFCPGGLGTMELEGNATPIR